MEFVLRPARMENAQAVVDLCNADEGRFRGAATHDLASRKQFWQRTEFSIQDDTQVAELEDGSLAAYAVVQDHPNDPTVEAAVWVDPTLVSAGIERSMLDWIESRAAGKRHTPPAAESITIKLPSEDVARAQQLTERGFKLVRHFVRMRVDLDSPPAPATFPEGITARSIDPAQDLPMPSTVHQESFQAHWGHVPRSLEQDIGFYQRWFADDPNLDPNLWFLAFEGAEPVGHCLGTAHWPGEEDLAYVFTLGVRPDWRARGIGKALLQHAFRAYYEADRARIELDVDADNTTGALRLYGSVGMHPKWQKDLYEFKL